MRRGIVLCASHHTAERQRLLCQRRLKGTCPMSTPSAGWYADPQNNSVQRYWDGETWTEHTSPAPSMVPAVVPNGLPLAPVEAQVSPRTMIASDKRDAPVQ